MPLLEDLVAIERTKRLGNANEGEIHGRSIAASVELVNRVTVTLLKAFDAQTIIVRGHWAFRTRRKYTAQPQARKSRVLYKI
jgi:hypothetical protein